MEKYKAVIDIETGGFNPKKNAIVEIAIIIIDEDDIFVDSRVWILHPYPRCPTVQEAPNEFCSYKQDAMAVHGITIFEVENGTPADQVAQELAWQFMSKNILDVIAHKATFDVPFIQDFLQRYGYQISMNPICTLEMSKEYTKKNNLDLGGHDLPNMCKHFGINKFTNHRAWDDAMATKELYEKLKA